MNATKIQHTLPDGTETTFRVSAVRETDRGDDWQCVVGYDAGLDLSGYSGMDAYPSAAIEAEVSRVAGVPVRFSRCTGTGCDAGAWEVWCFDTDEPAPTEAELREGVGA